MEYKVGTFRKAGLEAKWGKVNSGQPAIFVRNPQASSVHQRETWWLVDVKMFDSMKEDGILAGFDAWTVFGEFFSIAS